MWRSAFGKPPKVGLARAQTERRRRLGRVEQCWRPPFTEPMAHASDARRGSRLQMPPPFVGSVVLVGGVPMDDGSSGAFECTAVRRCRPSWPTVRHQDALGPPGPSSPGSVVAWGLPWSCASWGGSSSHAGLSLGSPWATHALDRARTWLGSCAATFAPKVPCTLRGIAAAPASRELGSYLGCSLCLGDMPVAATLTRRRPRCHLRRRRRRRRRRRQHRHRRHRLRHP